MWEQKLETGLWELERKGLQLLENVKKNCESLAHWSLESAWKESELKELESLESVILVFEWKKQESLKLVAAFLLETELLESV